MNNYIVRSYRDVIVITKFAITKFACISSKIVWSNDEKLKLNKHIDVLYKNANKQINVLYRFRNVFIIDEKGIIHNIFILANVNYCLAFQ